MSKLKHRALFLADIHFPLHDEALVGDNGKIHALTKKVKYNKIYLHGDLTDQPEFSRFAKDPRKQSTIVEAVELAGNFVTRMRKNNPKAEIVYKDGNHDVRYERYFMEKAPELLPLFDAKDFSMPSLLGFKKNNIKYYSENDLLIDNGLKITHGEACGKWSGLSCKKEMESSGGLSVISGHCHRLGWFRKGNQVGVETGFLGTLDYKAYGYLKDKTPEWHQGFAEGFCIEEDDGSVNWHLRVIEVINGSFVVDGMIF